MKNKFLRRVLLNWQIPLLISGFMGFRQDPGPDWSSAVYFQHIWPFLAWFLAIIVTRSLKPQEKDPLDEILLVLVILTAVFMIAGWFTLRVLG